MTMPFAGASSRTGVMGEPLLFGPSPEMSMTRLNPGVWTLLEQLHRKQYGAGDRGTWSSPDGGSHTLFERAALQHSRHRMHRGGRNELSKINPYLPVSLKRELVQTEQRMARHALGPCHQNLNEP